MKKVIVAIRIAVLLAIVLIAYIFQKIPQDPPELTITIGDKKLYYIVAKNKWQNAVYDREDTFKTILKGVNEDAIPYVELGNKVVVNFKHNLPKEFTIYDILIDENGNQIYPNMNNESIPVEHKRGSYSFELQKNITSLISSTYVEDKKNIRGFRMIAKWAKNECEYAFVIKTDADN